MFFGKKKVVEEPKVSQEEKENLYYSCRSSLISYEVCLRANQGDELACERLKAQCMECLAGEHCQQAAREYRNCGMRVVSAMLWKDRLGDEFPCQVQYEAMRKCLEKNGLIPIEIPLILETRRIEQVRRRLLSQNMRY
eukprot:TRINITY_DN17450_c1_g1_i3.p2 TRINITY_DN17450_c1_g1~~TRINITY_DN17450_c1_g1_i3.p2  ORF type:complete len:138 (-),score=7.11 TRINITY_DN17450_c1_g1_i3:270-683(-)